MATGLVSTEARAALKQMASIAVLEESRSPDGEIVFSSADSMLFPDEVKDGMVKGLAALVLLPGDKEASKIAGSNLPKMYQPDFKPEQIIALARELLPILTLHLL